ncbi:hypothetical protein CPB86DRAFT_802677 [Serendipita vermifera]|nr:hypothetical protein CPB86DRAFT_802677 [Serendipita vermifera]
MSIPVQLPHSRWNTLLDRVEDVDRRIRSLIIAADVGDGDEILSNKITSCIQALHLDHHRISNDVTTLRAMRLTNSYFSLLVEQKLFTTIAIGRRHDPAIILPQVVLQHMRFLTVYSYAFKTSSNVWSQIQKVKLDGIRFDGACLPLTYWGPLLTALPHTQISHFTLHLNFLSVCDEGLEDFASVILVLSRTVRVASFNFEATNDICRLAFQIIQKTFKHLVALKITNISPWNSVWVFRQDWTCIAVLQRLHLHSCRLSFSLLTEFLEYACMVVDFVMHDCIPQDASEGVAFVGLQQDRTFDNLSIPNQYRDGFTLGSIVTFRYALE